MPGGSATDPAVARGLGLAEAALRGQAHRARATRTRGRPGAEAGRAGGIGAAAEGQPGVAGGTRHPAASAGFFRRAQPVSVPFIAGQQGPHAVRRRWRGPRGARRGCRAWPQRPALLHRHTDDRSRVQARASCAWSSQRHGHRIDRGLLERGVALGRRRVARLMRAEGPGARRRTRCNGTTLSGHGRPVAVNGLKQEFAADAPHPRGGGDTTACVIGGSGQRYLAAILGLFLPGVAGWAGRAVSDQSPDLNALQMALTRRSPGVGWRRPSDQGRLSAAGPAGPSSKLSASPAVCAGGEWLRPRGDGAILLDHQERDQRTLRRVQERPRRVVRRSREALQPAASSSDTRPEQSGRVRATGGCASASEASPATQSDQGHRRQHPCRRFARCAAVGRVIIGGLGSADLLGWDSRAPAAVCNAGGDS